MREWTIVSGMEARVYCMGGFWSPRRARQNERLFFLSFGPA